MPLEPVKLDDLTWAALTTATRARIAAASKGQWTLHAPVDPGVTLLELYAYLYEQRLYWMDHATPELLRAILALFGFRPEPARAAAAPVQFTIDPPAVTIAAGTAVWLGRDDSLVFTTSADMTVVPLTATRLFGGSRDVTPDLKQGREAELFVGGEDEVRIELDGSDAPVAGSWLGILLLLDTSEKIAPQWDPSSTSISPPVTFEFFYLGPASEWKPLTEVEDGTGGLRRSGIVRVRVPADWNPLHLLIRRTAGEHPFPPRIVSLAPNAAIVRHRRKVPAQPFEWTENDCRPLPGLQLSLDVLSPDDVLARARPLEDTVKLRIRERDGAWQEWKPALDFVFAGPRDRVFVVDRERRTLLFGDGLTGRLPRPIFDGAPNVEVEYEAGGGTAGNIGSRLSWQGENAAAQTDILNPATAAGGAETETVDMARSRVAAALRTPDRAVTEPDYVFISTTTPGTDIVRAHVAAGFHPCSPCPIPGVVTVFVVPYAPRTRDFDEEEDFHWVAAPVPDPGTLEAVRKRVEAARLVGTEVYVAPPRYRAVRLLIDVDAPAHRLADLELRVFRGLRAFLDPLGAWPFGEPLRPSVLRREAQKAAGTGADVGAVAIGIDGNPPDEHCREIEVGPHDLVYLDELRLRLRNATYVVGGLR